MILFEVKKLFAQHYNILSFSFMKSYYF